MPDVLRSELSPNGNLEAVLEGDGRTVFLYLCGPPESSFGVRSVWVRNLIDAPEKVDVDSIKAGNPPVMPMAHCANPAAQPVMDAKSVPIRVASRRNGVAGTSQARSLRSFRRGVVPKVSTATQKNVLAGSFCVGVDARQCSARSFRQGRGLLAGLGAGRNLGCNPRRASRSLGKGFGEHANYYAIDNQQWPPKGLLRFRTDQCQVLATIGVSLQPQPNVEKYYQEASPHRRIELAAAMPADATDEAVNAVGQYLSAQSSMPWKQHTFLGSGHTIPCDSWPNKEYTFALLVDECPLGVDVVHAPVFGDNVNLLWFMPITSDEREIAVAESSGALRERLPGDRWRS